MDKNIYAYIFRFLQYICVYRSLYDKVTVNLFMQRYMYFS